MNYNYVSAGAGAGKTDWAINISKKYNFTGNNVLIIVPTINLCDDIEARSKLRIKAIHSKNTQNTAQTISGVFSAQAKSSAAPITIVITEASFLLMTHRTATERWVVIKDEALEPLQIYNVRIPDSVNFINSWFDLLPIGGNNGLRTLFRMIKATPACPKTTTVDDDILGHIHRVKHMLSDGNIDVLCNFMAIEADVPIFQYSCFIKPEIFADFAEVYMMSANFEHTFLYHQWQEAGVVWHDKTPASMTRLAPSHRARIHYWSEEYAWSRRRRIHDLAKYLEWFQQCEPGTDYIYSANNEQYINLPGERIPAQSHGLNRWRNYTKFMTCASYLINNSDEAIYQYYGTSTTDARGLRNTQMIYQQLMRTDLRNYNSHFAIEIYVPTLTEARELLLYLPEAQLIDARKTKAGQKTDISAKLKPNFSLSWNTDQEAQIPAITYSFGSKSREYLSSSISATELAKIVCIDDKNLIKHEPQEVLSKGVPVREQSVFAGKNGGIRPGAGRKYVDLTKKPGPIHPLLQYITTCDKKSIAGLTDEQIVDLKKNDTEFFITGILADKTRFLAENITGNADVIAFDFDDTELTDLQLQKIFKKTEYLQYTTISHKAKGKKRRFRLVIPCTRAMTIAEHRRLMNYYYDIIAEYPEHGLDVACIKPERKYYMPHAESQITHNRRNKKALDVDIVLSDIPREPIVLPPTYSDMDFTYPVTYVANNKPVIKKIYDIMATMTAGDRSDKAVKIGGIMGSSTLTHEEKWQIYNDLKMRNIDDAALQSVKKYAKL